MTIAIGEWWIYAGPGEGCGIRHRVISITGREIVTWSDVADPGQGYSWMGDRHEFLKCFTK